MSSWFALINNVLFVFRSFAIADTDYDGQVSIEEFQPMLDSASALPNKFGYNWWEGTCEDFFGRIDEDGDGSITFHEWLGFALKHYQEKATSLPVAFDLTEKEATLTIVDNQAFYIELTRPRENRLH